MIAPRVACLDLDTFFVSVERLLDPSLVGRPVIVGGVPGGRGVVCACSYEVRKFGVRSGQSIGEATRLAPPDTVWLPGQHGVYGPYAARVKEVAERFCPVVRTASIDEFYLDFHGCDRLYLRAGDADGDAAIERVAREMREAIQAEIGLPASVGLGVSRTVAKIASGLAKPAGVRMIRQGEELAVIGPLPVRKVPGIGPSAEARLVADGILTVNQLVSLPPGPLRARHGARSQGVWHALHPDAQAHLGEERPAFREHDPAGVTVGSISNERTFFEDLKDPDSVEAQLRALVERVCWRARKREARARTVALKLRTTDFHTITRSKTLRLPTSDEAPVREAVLGLYRAARDGRPVRLVGVQLSNLVGRDPQIDLPFGAQAPTPAKVIDELRARYGFDAVRLGAVAPRPRS
jgi:DNA polymerase-4